MRDGFIQLTLAGEDHAAPPLLVYLVPEKVEAIEVAAEDLERGAKTTVFCESTRNYNVIEPPEQVMKLYQRAMWASRSMTAFGRRSAMNAEGSTL